MKKLLSVVLSICMVLISVPVFAGSSNEVVKVQLSDQAMAEAVGGGTVDTQIVTNNGGMVQIALICAVTGTCSYTVTHNLDLAGGGGIVLTTGTVSANSSAMITVHPNRNSLVRVDMAAGTSAIKATTTGTVN